MKPPFIYISIVVRGQRCKIASTLFLDPKCMKQNNFGIIISPPYTVLWKTFRNIKRQPIHPGRNMPWVNDAQTQQLTSPAKEREQRLAESVEAVYEYLDKCDKIRDHLFMKLEEAIRCLPKNASLAGQLSPGVLARIDEVFLSSCKTEHRRGMELLEKGKWKMKPHQFVEHWGYATRNLLNFIKKLIKLSEIMSLSRAVAAINAERSPNNASRARWMVKNVDDVLKKNRSQGTRKHRREKAKQEENSAPVARMETPKSIAGGPLEQPTPFPHNVVPTPPQDRHTGFGARDDDAITITDEESGSTTDHFATVYEESLRQKSIESLRSSTSWLIEDVFDAVLPVFTSHDERTLVLNPGVIDVDNPTSNYGKEIRALKKSHEHLLIPLNTGRSHWMLVILSLPERKALIYDPLHSNQNIASAKTALESFVKDKEKFGRFNDWTFVRHPVSTNPLFAAV